MKYYACSALLVQPNVVKLMNGYRYAKSELEAKGSFMQAMIDFAKGQYSIADILVLEIPA